MLLICTNLLSVFICCLYVTFLCLLIIAKSFVLLLLHSGFVLSLLNIIHALDLESVCFDYRHLYNVLLLTCSISYLLLLWIHRT